MVCQTPFVPPFYCNFKTLTSGNSGYGGTVLSNLRAFKILFAFVVLTLFKLPDPGASIYVQRLLKFTTWGAQGCSKSPPRPVVPPLGHNIDSCIRTENLGYIMASNSDYQGRCSVKTGLIAVAECLHFAGMFFPNTTDI